MNYLQVTAFRPSLHVPDRHNTLHGLAMQCIAPVNILNLHNSLKPTIGSTKKCTELMTRHMIQRTCASRYKTCTPMCLFGGKGESKNGNEASPWKSIEKAMSSFKKEQPSSLEDVLRQQMEKQDYYAGGSGGDPPTGGGGGGGGGTEDEGFAGILDDILQVIFAILALIALYVYIIAGDKVVMILSEGFEFLAGKRGPRIRTIMYDFARFYQKFRAKAPYDPYWLEKAIISTPTCWDSPRKYERIIKRMLKSSKRKADSDDDYNGDSEASDKDSDAYGKDSDNDKNAYGDDSDDDDNNNGYAKKDDDNKNDNAYSEDEDVDDDF